MGSRIAERGTSANAGRSFFGELDVAGAAWLRFPLGHFARMDMFIRYPGLAFVPAVLFLAGYVQHRSRIGRGFRSSRAVIFGAGIVRLLYTIYEFS